MKTVQNGLPDISIAEEEVEFTVAYGTEINEYNGFNELVRSITLKEALYEERSKVYFGIYFDLYYLFVDNDFNSRSVTPVF